jgi:hypothetical protein
VFSVGFRLDCRKINNDSSEYCVELSLKRASGVGTEFVQTEHSGGLAAPLERH